MHHIVSKTDKTFKLEVKYINAVKGKVVSGVIYWLIITVILATYCSIFLISFQLLMSFFSVCVIDNLYLQDAFLNFSYTS